MEHNHYGGAGTYFTIASIIFGFIASFSVNEWAAIMAIGAGATGILFNVTKWWLLIRKRKK